MTHPLDNPVWAALNGPHERFVERHGDAVRYPAAVAPFAGIPSGAGDAGWNDLAELVGPGGFCAVVGDDNAVPDTWAAMRRLEGVQLVATPDAEGALDPELVTLGADDVPAMLALTKATQPGPFFPRTYELGHYLGLHEHGELLAMAGERMRPAGFTEISAVCTAPAARGRGLATRLIRHLTAEILGRSEVPFLHAVNENVGAIRLYESLGFSLRRSIDFTLVTAPGTPESSTDRASGA